MVEGFREILPYAAEKGVVLALENHGGITETPEQLLALVRAIDGPNFGVNLDTGNFHGDDPYADLAKLAPYAVNVQVKTEISRKGKPKEDADLARVDRHPPRGPLLGLRRPGIRSGRGPPEGDPRPHQGPPGADRLSVQLAAPTSSGSSSPPLPAEATAICGLTGEAALEVTTPLVAGEYEPRVTLGSFTS